MADQNQNPQWFQPKGRPVGGTEHSWCRAVSGGTGITVLALQFTKPPNTSLLQHALHKLQNSHPILLSKLFHSTTTNTFSFTIPTPTTTPPIQIKSFNLSSTTHLLRNLSTTTSFSPLHIILEHELNNNVWSNNPSNLSCTGIDLFFASLYELPDAKWVVVLRLHTVVCDLTTAVGLLRELKGLMMEGEGGGGTQMEMVSGGEVSLGIEDLIPSGKAKKPIWAHGLDMLSYSLNSLRSTNLKFEDVKGARCSKVVRLQLSARETDQILNGVGCKSRGMKLCGVLVAAGLMAAHSSNNTQNNKKKKKKYAVVTLTDCRSLLEPPLSTLHFGFYHSAILNMHVVNGGESLWDLASKSYTDFANSKKHNKHFSDMADTNFLMCKVIENPSLTSASSLRTSLISVFEDPVINQFDEAKDQEIELEDYMGCSSIHSVGPSIAIFDTIRGGRLDCVCVYPSPLHSREQMQDLVDRMKRILVDSSDSSVEAIEI
ncbi:unnamed protein product [Camellia sinensis]